MKKLDLSKVEWIIQQKRKETKNAEIAAAMRVSVRWVQKLWARYKDITPDEPRSTGPFPSEAAKEDNPDASKTGIVYPLPMGRPRRRSATRIELSLICSAKTSGGAVCVEHDIEKHAGIHIPHNTIHLTMKENGMAGTHPKKSGRRKWVRYERAHTNSMWHTDYKQLDDGRYIIAYEDDASRFITGWGVFQHITTENAITVLEEAIAKYGKPASILTDHGSQFYAHESEVKKKGTSVYEKKLVELDIQHILARVRHPQTNGKLERFFGELQRKQKRFEDVAGPPGATPFGGPALKDPVARFVKHYNYERAHMSLDWDNQETPHQAFLRKMRPDGEAVADD